MEHGVEVGGESSLLYVGSHVCAGRAPCCPRLPTCRGCQETGQENGESRSLPPAPHLHPSILFPHPFSLSHTQSPYLTKLTSTHSSQCHIGQ